jgi:hypothetical protein
MVPGKASRPSGRDAPDHQRHREGPISPQPARLAFKIARAFGKRLAEVFVYEDI